MKKIRIIFTLFLFLTTSVFAASQNLLFNQGWNLKGISFDNVPVSQFQNSNIHSIWKWDGNSWQIWSPDVSINNIIENYGLKSFDTINATNGFWIETLNNLSIEIDGNIPENSTLTIQAGWCLLSFPVNDNISVDSFQNDNISTIWKWSGNTWQIWTPDTSLKQVIENFGLKSFDLINATDGFWINSKNSFTISFDNSSDDATSNKSDNITLTVFKNFKEFVKPIGNAKIFNNENKFIGYTDIFGKIILPKSGVYKISKKGFIEKQIAIPSNSLNNFTLLYTDNNTINFQIKPKTILNDIGNWNLYPMFSFIPAKPAAKIFSNIDYSLGLIVYEYATKQDLTIYATQQSLANIPNAIVTFTIGLEDVLGNDISPEEAAFSAKLRVFVKKENFNLKDNETYGFYYKNNGAWQFLDFALNKTKAVILKTKTDKIGEFTLVKIPRPFEKTFCLYNEDNQSINGVFIFKSGLMKSTVDSCITLNFTNDNESFLVFSHGYEAKKYSPVSSENIVLEKLNSNIDYNIKDFFNVDNSTPVCIELDNESYGIAENYCINEDNFEIFSSNEQFSYTDTVKYGSKYAVFNSPASFYLIEPDTFKLLNKHEIGNNIFNSLFSINDNLVFIALTGDILLFNGTDISNQFSIQDLTFSSSIDFSVYKPLLYSDKIFIQTVNGKILVFNNNLSFMNILYATTDNSGLSDNNTLGNFVLSDNKAFIANYGGDLFEIYLDNNTIKKLTETGNVVYPNAIAYKDGKVILGSDKKLFQYNTDTGDLEELTDISHKAQFLKIYDNFLIIGGNGLTVYNLSANYSENIVNTGQVVAVADYNKNVFLLFESGEVVKITFLQDGYKVSSIKLNGDVSSADIIDNILTIHLKNGYTEIIKMK